MGYPVPEDYNELKKEYLTVRKELEEARQIHYESSREIKRLLAIEHDYEAELEALQREDKKREEMFKEKVLQLEQSINTTKESCNKKIQELEDELCLKNELVLKLQSELGILTSTCVKEEKDDSDKLIKEIYTLRDENKVLLGCIEDLKEQVKSREQNCFEAEQRLKECMGELEIFKEIIADKTRDIAEIQNLKEKLVEQVCELERELETAKRQPLGASTKGNSLFAEVDDRRVYLQTKISDMKAEYLSMKEKYTRLSQTLQHLRIEHKRLLENRYAELMEMEYDVDTINKANKSRIQELEFLLKKSNSELEVMSQQMDLKADTTDYFYKRMKEKEKINKELQDRLDSRSLTDTLMAKALRKANEEKRKWKLEALLKDHLLKLKQETGPSNEDIEEIKKRIAFELDNTNTSSEHITNFRSSVFHPKLDQNIVVMDEHLKLKYELQEESMKLELDTKHLDEIPKQEVNKTSSIECVSETAGDKSFNSTTSISNKTVENKEIKESILENSNVTRRVKFSSSTTSPVLTNSKRRGGTIVFSKPTQLFD